MIQNIISYYSLPKHLHNYHLFRGHHLAPLEQPYYRYFVLEPHETLFFEISFCKFSFFTIIPPNYIVGMATNAIFANNNTILVVIVIVGELNI